MKKNILTVVIMATSLINMILSAVLVFSVMPAMNKTSNLVDKVAAVVDLEIDAKNEEEEYTVGDLDTYSVTYEKAVTINLQTETDGKLGFAQLTGITVSFNTKAEDHDDIKTMVEGNDIYIQDVVKETIGEYAYSQIDETKIKAEIVKKLQEKYNTKAIVEVSLPGFLTSKQ